MGEDIHEKVESVFESDMETQELMSNLVQGHNNKDIAEATLDVAADVVADIQNPELEKYVWVTTIQIGKASGSEEVVQVGATKIQEWAEKHSDQTPGEMA